MSSDQELPSPSQILATHEEIEEDYDLKYRGIRIATPTITLREIIGDADDYETIWQRAAHLLRKLITEHIFEDGNKRTAWVVTREYLTRHDSTPSVDPDEVERVLKRIRRYEVAEIAEWLKSGELDRDRLYP